MDFLREFIKCRVRQIWKEVETQKNLIHKAELKLRECNVECQNSLEERKLECRYFKYNRSERKAKTVPYIYF